MVSLELTTGIEQKEHVNIICPPIPQGRQGFTIEGDRMETVQKAPGQKSPDCSGMELEDQERLNSHFRRMEYKSTKLILDGGREVCSSGTKVQRRVGPVRFIQASECA